MTILYKVESKDFNKGIAFLQKRVLCKISSKNIVAFVVLRSDDDYNNYNSNVYVCDVCTPWMYNKVMSSKELVSILEWSPSSEHLLVGYIGGFVEIWSPKNLSLNTWALRWTANITGEDIIYAKFFHNGKRVFFNTQKREQTFYAEKLERVDLTPTLVGRGRTATQGCMVITSSGMIAAFTLPKLETPTDALESNIELKVSMNSIGLSRNHIAHCSTSFCQSGAINVALNYGWQEQMIHCFKISLKAPNEDEISIKSEAQASIFLKPFDGKTISRLVCTRFGSEDIILVAYQLPDGSSVLEQWNLMRRRQAVHALLQKNKGDYVQTEGWEQIAQLQLSVAINDICVSRMLSDHMQIFLILDDSSVQVVEPGLKKVGHIQLNHFRDGNMSDCRFTSADLTPTNQTLIIFDNYGQLYAMQTPQIIFDKAFKPNNLLMTIGLLEYCIVTGCDASDVLMLNLSCLDTLIQMLTENFSRQPAFARQFYYSNFLSLKSNICRIQSKRHDFDDLIVLHSISITFKSLLRPSDLGCQDKSPADNLSMILAEYMPEVDTVLLNLDAKDFTVEPLTLQSLQQLIQWVADLALNLLIKLPAEAMKSKMNKQQVYNLSRDIVAINNIRELLVIIRIWGLLNPNCLPTYTKLVDNIDELEVLFRLLTRLAQNQAEPDDLLLDECTNLSTQLVIPPRYAYTPTTLLNTQILTTKPTALIFSTSVEPKILQEVQMASVVFAPCVTDGVSNLQLGSKVSTIRRCNRCGFVNSTNKVAKTSALKAWYNKWTYCHCGGLWINGNC